MLVGISSICISVTEARQTKRKAYDGHRETNIRLFLENLETQSIPDRVRRTSRYHHQHRRTQARGASRYISIQAWESKPQSSPSAADTPLLPENSPLSADSGPTYAEINRISPLLQNNTVSGVGGISPELLRYSSELLLDLQVPISKVVNPTGPVEYRRITPCFALHKIHSRLLPGSHLGKVPNCQTSLPSMAAMSLRWFR